MNTIKIETDKPIVVIPVKEYEAMKETIDILSSHPNIVDELKKERRKMDQGEYIGYDEFKKKHGF
jgi:PHD/YefM family antitoxin component YafN of YafNO toxin-antitoxin module